MDYWNSTYYTQTGDFVSLEQEHSLAQLFVLPLQDNNNCDFKSKLI